MIKNIEIKNFKSIKNLSVDLGRVNVLIGANGSGKTNFLEAIAMAGAASADKLEYEFLSNRIRLSAPEFMYNAFPDNKDKTIQINVKTHNKILKFHLANFEKKWQNIYKQGIFNQIQIVIENLIKGKKNFVLKETPDLHFLLNNLNDILSNKDLIDTETFEAILSISAQKTLTDNFSAKELSDFLIYSPEYSFLKKFEEPGQIIPLGIKGEGLFYVIKQIFSNKKATKQKEAIKKYLHLFDWFADISIPDNLISNEYKIAIKDKFLDPRIKYFDQKSTNEGFLFLLFYLVLFTHKTTPKFFAIDNIETGFNPKLCRKLMTSFVELSKNFNKQVILTTHNPAILDGLDLNDNNQRLFVVYRKSNGSTALERITQKPTKKKLSELWMSGIIGGLPDNF